MGHDDTIFFTSFMTSADQTYAFLTPNPELPRGSLTNHVTQQLRRAIIGMRLRPGTMIDKAEICARLGVSRSPVATAFARLEGEGLLEIIPQRGTMVSYVSFDAVREYVFIRKALEGEIVRALASAHEPGLLDRLHANIAQQEACTEPEDRERYDRHDLQFHRMLTDALGFRRLQAMVDSARGHLDRMRRMTNSSLRMRESIGEHLAIIKAIAKGDGQGAATVMHAHLDSIITEMQGLRHKHPDLFDDRKR
ncbi:GntR family transcriptional regulator [Pelagibacterium lacus]|uniref:GntR family transcriptional regulator n=2 Tax=Pelagibacterium lacus TaxID=2282655 RepID=A0A369W1K4_9HYPH|nr:GntR family transcriptional regulator [Pelagibacterium lacus]